MNLPLRAAARPLAILGWVALAALLAYAGLLILQTHVMVYDDEGYVLWSLRRFIAGQPLYTEVFSQYGPLFFLGGRALHAATGAVFDHDLGRALTLLTWLSTALVAGFTAARLAASHAAGWTAAALSFVILRANGHEPSHPGSFLALLTALAAWLGVEAILADRPRLLPWLIAPLAVVCALIKINVGVFLALALGGWMLVHTVRLDRLGNSARLLFSTAWALAPFLLAKAWLGEPKALSAAFVAAAGLFITAWMLFCGGTPALRKPDWIGPSCLAALFGGAVCGLIVFDGTRGKDLFEGILLQPLRHPKAYFYFLPPPAGILPALLAIGAMALVLAVPRWARSPRAGLVVPASIALVALLPERVLTLSELAYFFGPSLLAPLLLPLREQTPCPPAGRAALWVASVFAWQTLHAYPVAGSQVAWGSFLWAPLAIGVAWRALPTRGLVATSAALAVLAGGAPAARLIAYGRTCFRDSASLALPGARWLRPPPAMAHTIRTIHANLVRHAKTVFSLPGMMSFNLWSGRPAPTEANVTHWFSLLSDARQQEIIRALLADPEAMIVVQRDHLNILEERGLAPRGPLVEFLREEFRPVLRANGYELWSRAGREIDLIDSFVWQGAELIATVHKPSGPPVGARLRFGLENESVYELSLALQSMEAGPRPGDLRIRFQSQPGRFPPGAFAIWLDLLDPQGRVVATLAPRDASALPSAAAPRAED